MILSDFVGEHRAFSLAELAMRALPLPESSLNRRIHRDIPHNAKKDRELVS